MSTTTAKSASLGTALLVSVLVVSLIGAGLVVGTYSGLQTISSQNDSLKKQNDNLIAQVTRLQQNVTSLTISVGQLKSAVSTTLVDGTATCSAGTPYEIRFDNSTTGTLSSVVFSAHNFRVYLPNNILYNVFIVHGNNVFVTATPSNFAPSGSTMTGVQFMC